MVNSAERMSNVIEMYIPDNYDAFDRWDSDSEKEKHPVCSHCLEPIQDEYLYVIDEEIVCEDCLTSYYRKRTDSMMR